MTLPCSPQFSVLVQVFPRVQASATLDAVSESACAALPFARNVFFPGIGIQPTSCWLYRGFLGICFQMLHPRMACSDEAEPLFRTSACLGSCSMLISILNIAPIR